MRSVFREAGVGKTVMWARPARGNPGSPAAAVRDAAYLCSQIKYPLTGMFRVVFAYAPSGGDPFATYKSVSVAIPAAEARLVPAQQEIK